MEKIFSKFKTGLRKSCGTQYFMAIMSKITLDKK